jgi:predicted Fe-Mo cluster-binding NifX family protein
VKTAISSTGNTPEALIDKRFARCNFFVIHDKETGSVEYLPNPAKDAEDGAGPAAVQLVANRKVHKIISGEFGLKIKPLLDSLKIQMVVITDPKMTVGRVIEMLGKK